MWWCRRAPTARAQLGPHSSPPLTSRVRRAAGGATRKGPRAPRGLLARSWCGPPLLQLTPPAPLAEGCYSPTSLPAFLAPLAPPHTRRFLGDSLDARLLSRCAPASLQMRANAVFAPILRRLAWLLFLNMVPGARGLAVASMMAPLMRRTHIRRQPCQLVSHRSLHPPRPRPLLKRVRACFFSCTGL